MGIFVSIIIISLKHLIWNFQKLKMVNKYFKGGENAVKVKDEQEVYWRERRGDHTVEEQDPQDSAWSRGSQRAEWNLKPEPGCSQIKTQVSIVHMQFILIWTWIHPPIPR